MSGAADVVVVGAGPAGLAAAMMLAKAGMRVRVFDRKRFPIDKVCGEGLMPPGLRFLEKIGAATDLGTDDCHSFAGICYHTPTGKIASAEFAEGPGLGIRRTALSQAMVRPLADERNVKFYDGVGVKSMRSGRQQMEVVLDDGEVVHCRLVVGADGLRSRVREWANLNGKPAGRVRLGIRQHFEIAPWSRFVEVYAGDAMEAYVTPSGARRVGVAILWERDRAGELASGAGLFGSLLARFPELNARLADARTMSDPLSTGPLSQNVVGRVADGVALIGDAGGYVDACTGEGLTLAFKQAEALADSLLDACMIEAEGVITKCQLYTYARSCRKICRPYKIGTRFMLRLYRHRRSLEWTMRLLHARPVLLQHLLSFNMGTAPLHRGMLRALISKRHA